MTEAAQISKITLIKNKKAYVLRKDVIISEIAKQSPRAVGLLLEYGLHCVSCVFNQFDTLETGAGIHGMSQEEVETMIDEINEQLETENA